MRAATLCPETTSDSALQFPASTEALDANSTATQVTQGMATALFAAGLRLARPITTVVTVTGGFGSDWQLTSIEDIATANQEISLSTVAERFNASRLGIVIVGRPSRRILFKTAVSLLQPLPRRKPHVYSTQRGDDE